jgi:hypothetical protein
MLVNEHPSLRLAARPTATTDVKHRGKWKWLNILAFLLITTLPTGAQEPKRILLLHSFGPDFSPWNEFAKAFRAELDQQTAGPVDVYEAALAIARSTDEIPERPFAEYRRSLFDSQKIDLTVTIGAPAAAFFQKYRQLNAMMPALYTALEQRGVSPAKLTAYDTVVAIKVDVAAVVENILRILPRTTNIAIVLGNSPNEKFWSLQVREALLPYANRVGFTWFNKLSLEVMLLRSKNLPPHSAILFALLSVDAAGVPHDEGKALDRLHAVANAPIFSYVDAYFGRGIVGGPLISVRDVSKQAAEVVFQVVRGQRPEANRTAAIGFAAPRFDWREMKRWDVAEAALPAGSIVEFRVPTVFEQYKWYLSLLLPFVCLKRFSLLHYCSIGVVWTENVSSVCGRKMRRTILVAD